MVKVYINKLLKYPYLPVLYPNLGIQKTPKHVFLKGVFDDFIQPIFELVKNPNEADYFLLPHDYFWVEKEYIKNFSYLSKIHNKKILIFTHSDFDEDIPVPNSIIFRTSQYRYKKGDNEIIMPAYAEDLSVGKEMVWRVKGDKAIVGFCGWADFKNFKQKLIFYLKVIVLKIRNKFADNKSPVHYKGLWFRRRALQILRNSHLIKTNFLIRNTFSGHQNTISLNPEKARREYIDNMISSDFILTIKGDGNFSLRFYEALSLGRIPLFINTDCVLPLENLIHYKDFVLFVDYQDIERIDKILSDFYAQLSTEDFLDMQKKARDIFERYLRIDSFFKNIPAILDQLNT